MQQRLMSLGATALIILAVILAACSAQSTSPEPAAADTGPQITIVPTFVRSDPALATPTLAATGDPLADLITVVHVIQPGETLYEIALNYNVPMEQIVALNDISDPGRIAQGDELKIPLPRPTVTPDPLGPTPTFPPPPGMINGVPYERILQIPEEVREHAREIFVAGQEMGINARAFSKVGDSTIENPFFLARFDEGDYNLADYAYLQGVINQFAGSFARDSIAVRQGMHSWSMMDPVWADKNLCQPNEAPLPCEIRLHRPAVLLLRLGSNDVGVPESFRSSMQEIISYAIDSGVIPVVGTKADRFEGSNINNDILRELAAANRIPLWDFDAVAATVPGKGLDTDNVHLLTFYTHDYNQPGAFEAGHALHNLSALVVLDLLWQAILQ